MEYIENTIKLMCKNIKEEIQHEFIKQKLNITYYMEDIIETLNIKLDKENDKKDIPKDIPMKKNLDLYQDEKWIKSLNEINTLKAIDLYNELISEYPNEPEIYRNLGIKYYFETKEYKKALDTFSNLLEIDKYDAYALLMVSKSHEQLGDCIKSEEPLVTATQCNKSHLIELVEFYIRENNLEDALKFVKLAEKNNLSTVSDGIMYKPAYFLKSLILYMNDELNLAEEYLKNSHINFEQGNHVLTEYN